MNNKELKKLSRTELLELLIDVTKENNELKAQNEELQSKLNDKLLAMGKAGSIAEASLELNGIFTAAQDAAEQYLLNVQQSNAICENMQKEAEEQAKMIRADADKYAEETVQQAKNQADAYWIGVSQRLEAFYQEHQGLKELLGIAGNTASK